MTAGRLYRPPRQRGLRTSMDFQPSVNSSSRMSAFLMKIKSILAKETAERWTQQYDIPELVRRIRAAIGEINCHWLDEMIDPNSLPQDPRLRVEAHPEHLTRWVDVEFCLTSRLNTTLDSVSVVPPTATATA